MKTYLALAAAAAIGLAMPGTAATITYTLTGGFNGVFGDGTSLNAGYFTTGTITAVGDTSTQVGSTVTLSSFQFVTNEDTYVASAPFTFSVDNVNQEAIFAGTFGVFLFGSPDFATYSGVADFPVTDVTADTFAASFDSGATTFGVSGGGGKGGLTFSAVVDGTPSAAPEPATWAMMVGGFGLVGGALRRRKAIVRFA